MSIDAIITTIMLILVTLALVLLGHENVRTGRPRWTNLVLKWVVGTATVFLTAFFIYADGEAFLGWLSNHTGEGGSAFATAVVATIGGAMLYGTIVYLFITPDQEEDPA